VLRCGAASVLLNANNDYGTLRMIYLQDSDRPRTLSSKVAVAVYLYLSSTDDHACRLCENILLARSDFTIH
jgi:hypothetical protein